MSGRPKVESSIKKQVKRRTKLPAL